MEEKEDGVLSLRERYRVALGRAGARAYCKPGESGPITVTLILAVPAGPNFLADLPVALILDGGEAIPMRIAEVRRRGNITDLALVPDGEGGAEGVVRGTVLSNIAEIEIGDSRFRLQNIASRSAFERSCAAPRSPEEDVLA